MVKIPFFTLQRDKELLDRLKTTIDKVISSGHYIGGNAVAKFEGLFAEWLGVPYCVSVSNGTMALAIALRAVGVKPGDNVITVPNSFFATAEAISMIGAIPKFVDVRFDTLTMDPELIETVIDSRTSAIIPVHLYGHPADMPTIRAIADRFNLKVVEDCAQAHGAEIDGQKVGTWGDAAAFSFYPSKNLGACGDGGCIVMKDETVMKAAESLRDHGQVLKNTHFYRGYNSRLDAIQAAVLTLKLRFLEGWNIRRREIANHYIEILRDSRVILPFEAQNCMHVFHLFVVRIPDRDKLKDFLDNENIQTAIHYPIPIHLQQAYHDLDYRSGMFPVAEDASREVLSLPMFPELLASEITRVGNAIWKFERG